MQLKTETAKTFCMAEAAHDIPYHNVTSDAGMTLDRDAAEAFKSSNALVLDPGEEIRL